MTPALGAPNAFGHVLQMYWKWFHGTAAKQVKLLLPLGLKIALVVSVAKPLAQPTS
jgi:hypothetical protein